MKVYMDTCSLQRPLDARDHIRIALEAEAVVSILGMIESGEIDIISSDALLFECDRNTNSTRKEFAFEILKLARIDVGLDDDVLERAKLLIDNGLIALDALHVALAEKAGADIFCTCDDRLLKKARALCDSGMKVLSPIEMIVEVDK